MGKATGTDGGKVKGGRVGGVQGTFAHRGQDYTQGSQGASPLIEVCPFRLRKKAFSQLSGMPGGPASPSAAPFNLLQTGVLLLI